MGLDIQIGALGAENEHFKKRPKKCVFFFLDCNTSGNQTVDALITSGTFSVSHNTDKIGLTLSTCDAKLILSNIITIENKQL